MFPRGIIDAQQAQVVPMRLLAHLGDAVLHLYEREREVLQVSSARDLHARTRARVSAQKQAELLDGLSEMLTETEKEIVRRARNLKPTGYRKVSQSTYRKSTAFEALVGYLYLTDTDRLSKLLQSTLTPQLTSPDP